jgi:predicted GNAT family acetyltransferase
MASKPDQLEVIHHPEEGRFEIVLDKDQAVLDYRLEGSTIYFLHTGVPPEYEGKGIGSRLARAGLDFARQNGYQIVAYCSFIDGYLSRHPEYLA